MYVVQKHSEIAISATYRDNNNKHKKAISPAAWQHRCKQNIGKWVWARKKFQARGRMGKWEVATEKSHWSKQMRCKAVVARNWKRKGGNRSEWVGVVRVYIICLCSYMCMVYVYSFALRCFCFIVCNFLLTLV